MVWGGLRRFYYCLGLSLCPFLEALQEFEIGTDVEENLGESAISKEGYDTITYQR
jgi:hypothetical protein